MAAKSSHAFRTISEASNELGLKPHVLRFWEVKFPELKPVTRAGGRRFYRPQDVDFLRGLRILLHEEKMKIKDVQKIIKKKGADEVIKLGASSISRLPPKPVTERNLVPDHITASVPKPVIASSRPAAKVRAPQDDDSDSGSVVPFSAARAAKSPAESAPAPAPAAQPAATPAPAPAAETVQTPQIAEQTADDLENALDRLSALRSRWKKFAD